MHECMALAIETTPIQNRTPIELPKNNLRNLWKLCKLLTCIYNLLDISKISAIFDLTNIPISLRKYDTYLVYVLSNLEPCIEISCVMHVIPNYNLIYPGL